MDFLLSYLITGVVFAWAADQHQPTRAYASVLLIIFWLPIIVGLGIIERRKR